MSNHLSAIAWFTGTVLAAIVVVGGVQTSSARFSGSTSNRSNLWQAAELSLEVGRGDGSGGEGASRALFLKGEGLYPGVELVNCVPVTITTTLDQIEVRLHGQALPGASEADSRGDLSPYFNIEIELGSAKAGCDDFRRRQSVFSDTLAELTLDHPSFEDGLALNVPPGEVTYLRFTGTITDTNDAQDLDAEYVVHIEVRP